MERSTEPIKCFTCRNALGDPLAYPTLADGSPCPACAERLLESLPPLLQMQPQETPAAEEETPV